jgi:serine/threonine protein phosphatase PrpC
MTGTDSGPAFAPTVAVHAMTHPGHVRNRNEDAVGASRWSSQHTGGVASHRYSGAGGVVCVVADGVGGQPAGDVASALAVDELVHGTPPADTEELRDRIRALHQTLLDRGAGDPALSGMATTLAVLVAGETVLCANVGDTRIYDLSTGSAFVVSVDDTPQGLDGDDGPARTSLITQALGGRASSLGDPHVQWFAREAGLVFLLCTDGITNVVSDEEISARCAAEGSAAAFVRGLVELALERGAPDNVTVMTARIDAPPEPPRR